MEGRTKLLIIFGIAVMLICGCLALNKVNKQEQEPEKPIEVIEGDPVDPNAPPQEEYLNPKLEEYEPKGDGEEIKLDSKEKEKVQKLAEEYTLDLKNNEPTWLAKIYNKEKAHEYSFTNTTDIPIDYKLRVVDIDCQLPPEEVRIFSEYTGEILLYDNPVIASGRLYPGDSTGIIPVYYYLDYYINDYLTNENKDGHVKFKIQLETSPSSLLEDPFQKYFVSYSNGDLLFDSLLYDINVGEKGSNSIMEHQVTIDGQEYMLKDEGEYVAGDDYIHDIYLSPGEHEMEVTVNGYTYKGKINID